MMELGSPVTWTTLCNLFYVFFILLVLILVCITTYSSSFSFGSKYMIRA